MTRQENLAGLKTQYEGIESNLRDYQLVNQRIAKLQIDLQTIQGQVDQWYGAMIVEVFDAKNWNPLRFTKAPKTETTPEHWVVEISLKRKPIPASLRISRASLSVQTNLVTVLGNKVSFVTFDDKQDSTLDTISVQYHPLSP